MEENLHVKKKLGTVISGGDVPTGKMGVSIGALELSGEKW